MPSLNEEGRGGGFVVLLNYYYSEVLFVLSSNMEWSRFKRFVNSSCHHLFTFKGKFYAIFLNGDIFVINPYNLMEAVPLMPPRDLNSSKYLVPSGDDEELLLVEKIIPTPGVLDFGRAACRVSRLDEEVREWVVVSDLGDRVLFIGQLGNVSCSGKELPDGCGLTGNSILFTNEPGHVNYVYKYGVDTGNAEDDLSFWRLSRENRVLFRNRYPPVVALRVESPKPNWSLLPEKLLQLISTHLEKKSCCFFIDAIHARSVCNSWRSTFHLPDLNQSYTLPSFSEFARHFFPSVSPCTLKKFPLFLFRVQTQTPPESPPPPSEFFLGGICREDDMELLSPDRSPPRFSEYFLEGIDQDDELEDEYPESPPSPSVCFLGGIVQEDDHTELSSPFQCTVKADFPEYHPILTNMLGCQILPLGHRYKIMGPYPDNSKRNVAFLPLNKEEKEFVVLFNLFGRLLVYRSSEMRWIQFERIWGASCMDLVTFRGKFYAIFLNGEIFVIDPYNPMEATPRVTPQDPNSSKYLVPSGNDEELFLVEKTISACRVSKLDEKAVEWIAVSDLGNRVLIIRRLGNVAFSVKEFPDGCGLSRNSILITEAYDATGNFSYKYGNGNDSNVTFAYKYDDHGFWRLSREDRVLIRNKSAPVLALRVDRVRNKCFL